MLKTAALCAGMALALLLPASCDGKGDCEKVASHMLELLKKDVPEQERPAVDSARADLIAACKKENISKQTEKCLLEQKQFKDLGACYRP